MSGRTLRYYKRYRALRHRLNGEHLWVDVGPTREIIQGWLDAGFTTYSIGRVTGHDGAHISGLATGRTNLINRFEVAKFRNITLESLYANSEGKDLVPAIGVQRRLQAIAVIGHCGIALTQERNVATRFLTGTHSRVTIAKHREYAKRYRSLVRHPGTNMAARNRAKREGWAGPMDWPGNTIDDPRALPESDPYVAPDRRTEVVETVRDGLAGAMSAHAIAAVLGISFETMERALRRYNEQDLVARLLEAA